MNPIRIQLLELIQYLQNMPGVQSIGKTGGSCLPEDGLSDVDLFVFCDSIPALEIRAVNYACFPRGIVVAGFGEAEDPHWGLVDSFVIGRQEVYLMYFSADAFAASVSAILRGERTERESNYFYPTGRCASILGMHAYRDPQEYIARLQDACTVYPDALRDALLASHLPKIDDEEDFQRAIRRGDVLFFHATLDLALDHFLQALFALNRVYFPSRKRSLEFITEFAAKPENCETRLTRIIELGAKAETLSAAYLEWHELCRELILLYSK